MEQFIARQPIFDRKIKLFGYELLFQSGVENCFCGIDGDQATSRVIAGSALLFGFDSLPGNGRGFVNFTRKALLQNYASVLPKKRMVVEILENVEPDAEVMEACHRLKKKGYALALDDNDHSEGDAVKVIGKTPIEGDILTNGLKICEYR